MPINIIEKFEVKFLQILNENGDLDEGLAGGIKDADIKRFFEAIVLARTFNQRALSLQREGRIGTYASILGQEAAQIGSALATSPQDWIFPTFRESGVFVAKGYPLWMLYRYWAGDERGMQIPENFNLFPMSVPVGTQIPHAMGAAWAMKLKGDRKAAVAYFGDGASSRGDFHEGLNFAGVFGVPAVFICQNNQWAISVPRARQTAAKTIAQRAIGYGFEGIQVDGNDALAVYKATKDALEKAKSGGGPTLIECYTYRLDDHTTSDDASRYRPKEEVEPWKAKEPLIRLRALLKKKGIWSEDYEENLTRSAQEEVDKSIVQAEAFKAPDPSDIVRHTYAELTPEQERDLEEFGWLK